MLSPSQIGKDSELFAASFLKIINKDDILVPFKWNKVQRDFHRKKTGRDLVLKSRQLGLSTYEQGDIFRDLVTKTTRALTLSHDDTTTQILRQTADRFYEHCYFNNYQPARRYANATMTTYLDYDSSHVIGTAGNTEIGRGGSYSRIHGSEVAKWKDASKILAGAMQGGRPSIVLESTPNGAQGTFYELCMEALHGDSIWTVHFYPWWWDEQYRVPLGTGEPFTPTDEEMALSKKHGLCNEQLQWRRGKIRELGRLFIQEYPEDSISCFLTSGNSYFGDLSGVFTAPPNAQYIEGHEYIAGLDFGQTNDFTAMPIIDKTTMQQVDLLHIRKLEWAEQRKRISEMYKKWHCKKMAAESNSIGSVNIEALRRDGLNIQAFTTTNNSKADIMSKLYEAIHTDGLKMQNHPEQRHEFNTFVSTQTATGAWKLAADGDGHDDIVMSMAIAWWIAHTPIQIFM